MFNMIIFHQRITENFALDICGFYTYRSFKDGISFLELNINFDKYKADHNPKFQINLRIFNFTILEVDIYNVNHVEQEKE